MLKKLRKTNKKSILTVIIVLLFLTTIMGVGSFSGTPGSNLESNPILSTNYNNERGMK